MPPPEQLKAALNNALTRHQKQLADKGAELEAAKATAAATQGSLDACSALLQRQQREAEGLQAKLDAKMAKILNGVSILPLPVHLSSEEFGGRVLLSRVYDECHVMSCNQHAFPLPWNVWWI